MHRAQQLCVAIALSVLGSTPCRAGVTVALVERPVSSGVEVAVRLENIAPAPAAGYQIFLEFDSARLSYVSGEYVTDHFGLAVISPIASGVGTIALAAGISPFVGQVPTGADQDVAILRFARVGSGCAALVRVRTNNQPPTRVTGDDAQALLPLGAVNLWPECPADTNNGGTVTVQDLFDFLGMWFASDCRADFNNAGGVSVQDLFDFLAAWFAGC